MRNAGRDVTEWPNVLSARRFLDTRPRWEHSGADSRSYNHDQPGAASAIIHVRGRVFVFSCSPQHQFDVDVVVGLLQGHGTRSV